MIGGASFAEGKFPRASQDLITCVREKDRLRQTKDELEAVALIRKHRVQREEFVSHHLRSSSPTVWIALIENMESTSQVMRALPRLIEHQVPGAGDDDSLLSQAVVKVLTDPEKLTTATPCEIFAWHK